MNISDFQIKKGGILLLLETIVRQPVKVWIFVTMHSRCNKIEKLYYRQPLSGKFSIPTAS